MNNNVNFWATFVFFRLITENEEGSSEISNAPGWYTGVSIELDIDSLAVCTLLQSHHVTDIEGTNDAITFDNVTPTSVTDLVSNNTLSTYDETTRCIEAFKILKSLVTTWMRDITIHRNIFADFQVVHFYR